MIGVSKRIIAIHDDGNGLVLFKPEIIKYSDAFEAEEGCLSLEGTRKTKRYKTIKLRYQNAKFQQRLETFKG